MPANCLITWEPKTRRWAKMLNGKRYVVSCRQLSEWAGTSVPESKEQSYQYANKWWESKIVEVEGHRLPHPHADYIAKLTQRLDSARRHGEKPAITFLAWEISRIQAGGEPGEFGRHYASIPESVSDYAKSLGDSSLVTGALNPLDEVWSDRVTRDGSVPMPEERAVKEQVRRFLAIEMTRVEGDILSLSEYDLIRLCLADFETWLGGESCVDNLNAERWEGYWQYLIGLKKKLSNEYLKKRLRHARNFIEWLATKGLIAAPPNLHFRKYKLGSSHKSVPTMTVDEVRMLIERATGQLKLHLLLMINCGMQQKDISDLRHDEIDWERGTITRKRSKTGDMDNVPTVTYRLWPITWELLQTHRTTEGERVLVTKTGRPWHVERIVNGRRSRSDNIAANYQRMTRILKFGKPLKLLRKTSASLLDNHETYGLRIGQFLGHAPRSVQDKSYRQPSQEQFELAIAWLGKQYGFHSD